MGGADPLAEEGWEALSSELCAAVRGDCSVAVREEWERLVREYCVAAGGWALHSSSRMAKKARPDPCCNRDPSWPHIYLLTQL